MLNPDRYFSPVPAVRDTARALYERVVNLPLVCPHGHVDPRMLAEDTPVPYPAALIVVPDHYLVRMMYAQGVPMESLGIPRLDGGPTETDPHKVWQVFADHFYLFRGTPSGAWLAHELESVLGITERLDGASAMRIYDRIEEQLAKPEFRPRALFERFRIEVLCTTDTATDTLEWHRMIRDSEWAGNVRPTFRPDLAVNILHPAWKDEIGRLGALTGREVRDYRTYIRALEERRAYFKSMGAAATDHAAVAPFTCELSAAETTTIFERALNGCATDADARAFSGQIAGRTSRSQRSTRATCGRSSTSSATTPRFASCSSRSTRRPTPESWRRWRATTLPYGSDRPGGSTTALRACCASGTMSPKRPASTTPRASTTTRARSCRFPRATTSHGAWTRSSSRTSCRATSSGGTRRKT